MYCDSKTASALSWAAFRRRDHQLRRIVAIKNATRLLPRRSGRPTSATERRKQIPPQSHGSIDTSLSGHKGTRDDRPASSCLQAIDASDQTGASLPCWTLGPFSPGSELARMKHQNHYRRDPSTSDIHCGDLRHRRCIGPDFLLDR